jgi:group I intron endonuclease
MSAIIYLAENTINHKKYVGFTSKSLKHRINEHEKNALRNSEFIFHRAIRKYGFDAFTWQILESNEDANYTLNVLEPKWIKESNSYYLEGQGYNMTRGGEGAVGAKRSKETKKKISNALKNNKNSLGRIVTEEMKENLRRKNLGKKVSAVTRKKLSESHKGFKQSEKTKEKLRKLFSGKNNPMYGKSILKFTWQITTPSGQKIIIGNLNKYCKENDLNSSLMSQVAKGEYKQHHGYNCEKLC